MPRGRVWIGTSGWSYKHWLNGAFYPPKLPADQYLPFYAAQFSTVELNYSFYQLPPRSAFEAWRARTPAGFLFAVKASRYLTHVKRLTDPREPLERLLESAGGLGPKLGPLLFQFPPRWPMHLDRLRDFLALKAELAPGQRWAFEFRH